MRAVVCNFVLESPDPAALSSFYIELLDLKRIGEAYEDWVMIGREEGVLPYLAFTGVKDYRAPRWPDPAYPQQAHLDLIVDDLEAAAEMVFLMGGSKLADKGHVYPIDIFADPVGHPFCMCEGSPWWHSASIGTYAASQP